MEYYLHNGNEKRGPFTLEQLETSNIQETEYIWHAGLQAWTKVIDIPEVFAFVVRKKIEPPPFDLSPPEFIPDPSLAKPAITLINGLNSPQQSVVQPTPPPIPSIKQQTPPPIPSTAAAAPPPLPTPIAHSSGSGKKSTIGKVVKIIGVIALIGFGLLIASKASHRNSYSPPPTTYNEMKQDMGYTEGMNPGNFLHVDYNHRKAIIGGKYVIDGSVRSSAKVMTFKDLVVRVTFHSSTGTAISYQDCTIYDFVKPNARITYNFRLDAPKATSDISINFVRATPNY